MPEFLLPALVISLVGFIMLGWVFDGYARLLAIGAWFRPAGASPGGTGSKPTVAVLLTVHDEQETIAARLENLVETSYPNDLLEIVVVSDRSTDATDEIVRDLARKHPVIRLESFDGAACR